MATRKIPSKAKELNIFVSGVGFLGTIESYKLPVVKTKKDVMNGVHVDSGRLEPMEFEADINSANSTILQEASKLSEASLKLKGEYLEDNVVKKLTATLTGSVDMEVDTIKDGDAMKTKVKMYVNVYNLNLGGDEVYDIDLPNMIAKIGGKDIYESTRSAVM